MSVLAQTAGANSYVGGATGGIFFGTVPDGKRVLAALNRQPSMSSPMLELTAQTFCEDAACAKQRRPSAASCAAHEKAAPQPFGSAYTCAIGDTVTQGAAPLLRALSTGTLFRKLEESHWARLHHLLLNLCPNTKCACLGSYTTGMLPLMRTLCN